MPPPPEPPTLLRLLFGESASAAQAGASPKLLAWARVFDEWLQEEQDRYREHRARRLLLAWRRLLAFVPRAPWEIDSADIQAFMAHMRARGYAASTIRKYLRAFELYYLRLERELGSVESIPNPVVGVEKPKHRPYEKAHVLARDETRRLLAVLRASPSLLSQRDYAFFLARLTLGAPLDYLLKLTWGQLRWEGERLWVEWGRGAQPRSELPREVWDAIYAYLSASGRLEGIQDEDYIFTPLKDPLGWEETPGAEVWNAAKACHRQDMLVVLKRFGRLVGIPEEKLRLATLKHTAVALRLEAGDGLHELMHFLCKDSLDRTGDYLRLLASRAAAARDAGSLELGGIDAVVAPPRQPNRFQPAETVELDPSGVARLREQIQEILDEDIHGLGEEIEGLRLLNGRLLEASVAVEDPQSAAQLRAVYIRSVGRLADLTNADTALQVGHHAVDSDEAARQWVRDFAQATGESEEEMMQELEAQAAGGMDLRQEIAGLRLVARRTLESALAAFTTTELISRVDAYGRACIGIMKLAKAQRARPGRMKEIIIAEIQEALMEFAVEKNLSA